MIEVRLIVAIVLPYIPKLLWYTPRINVLHQLYSIKKKGPARSANAQVLIIPPCLVTRCGLPWEGSLQLRQRELITRGCLWTASGRYTQMSP